jgi:hypothetical protein
LWPNRAEIVFSTPGDDPGRRQSNDGALLGGARTPSNSATLKGEWRFTTANARIKLRKLQHQSTPDRVREKLLIIGPGSKVRVRLAAQKP